MRPVIYMIRIIIYPGIYMIIQFTRTMYPGTPRPGRYTYSAEEAEARRGAARGHTPPSNAPTPTPPPRPPCPAAPRRLSPPPRRWGGRMARAGGRLRRRGGGISLWKRSFRVTCPPPPSPPGPRKLTGRPAARAGDVPGRGGGVSTRTRSNITLFADNKIVLKLQGEVFKAPRARAQETYGAGGDFDPGPLAALVDAKELAAPESRRLSIEQAPRRRPAR